MAAFLTLDVIREKARKAALLQPASPGEAGNELSVSVDTPNPEHPLNPQPRKRISPIIWFAPRPSLAIVAALAGTFVFWREDNVELWAITMVTLVIALFLIDVLLAVAPTQVAIDRQIQERQMLNTTGLVRWAVGNAFTRTMRVQIVDSLPHSFMAPRRDFFLKLKAGEVINIAIPIRPQRRGILTIGGPVVRTFGPLGLAVRHATVELTTEVMVNPAFPSRPVAELKLRDARRLLSGMRMVRLVGQTGEFDHLREYTPDDEIRRINWAATARAQKPIVQVNRAEKNQRVIILLDHGRTMAGTMRRFPPDLTAFDTDKVNMTSVRKELELNDIAERLDHAMDAAMGLTLVATGMADHVGLVSFDHEISRTIAPATGASQLRYITDALANVHVNIIEPDFKEAAAQTVTRFSRRSLVVILTDLATGPVEENLLPALPQLTRRHIVIVASPRDPVLASMQTLLPQDDKAAYAMVAAIHRMNMRKAVAKQLTNAGAIVLDTDPQDLTPRLIDTYLDLKSAGRL